MATAGWASFTSTNRREIVIAALTPVEWNGGEDGLNTALGRISAALGRDDLRVVQIVRVEPASSAADLSFQQFRMSYRAPKVFYTSVDSNQEARLESEQSLEEFVMNGDVITNADA